MELKPVTLEGKYVRLVPMSMAHLSDLCSVGLDPELWRWTPFVVRTPEEMRNYVESTLQAQLRGTALPFTIIEVSSGAIIGSSRYMNIEKDHLRLEIGSTWYGRQWQRTPVNTEAKYLMLKHAFEELGCIRVEFKTDSLNEPSRIALLRIGAQQEGVFRNHMLTYSGRIRHTVYFSIINSDWPIIESRLKEKLQRPFHRNS
jgi:N-acetyltransferase